MPGLRPYACLQIMRRPARALPSGYDRRRAGQPEHKTQLREPAVLDLLVLLVFTVRGGPVETITLLVLLILGAGPRWWPSVG